MRNVELLERGALHDKSSRLHPAGWSRQFLLNYTRDHIKASALRIKEWDYYLISAPEFALALTLSDNGYMGLQSVTFLDFKQKTEHTEILLTPFPLGRMRMPANPDAGQSQYKGSRLKMTFVNSPDGRRISGRMAQFSNGSDIVFDLSLSDPPRDSMNIVIPWANKPRLFYYNHKVNGFRAQGRVELASQVYRFNPANCFATEDWGRGVWSYNVHWYWSSANGLLDGKRFSFNLGYGFGDTSAATENIVFFDGVGHKLNDITFHIPADDYLKPWRFNSSDGRFEATFQPLLNRSAHSNVLGLLKTDQNQVFGHMSGQTILDDGQKLVFQDLLCFAEDVKNRF